MLNFPQFVENIWRAMLCQRLVKVLDGGSEVVFLDIG